MDSSGLVYDFLVSILTLGNTLCLKWTRLDSSGLAWTRLDSSGLAWTRLDSAGLGWTRSLFSCIHSNSWEYLVFKLDLAGLGWTRLDSAGLVWTRLDSFMIFLFPL